MTAAIGPSRLTSRAMSRVWVERGKVADDDDAAGDEVVDGAAPFFVSDVDDNLVPCIEQHFSGQATEAVGRARNEEPAPQTPVSTSPALWRALSKLYAG